MLARCGQVNDSLTLFSMAQHKTIVTWTSLITYFSHSLQPFEALSLFSQLRASGLLPNHFTFSAILPACAHTSTPINGKQMHSLIVKHGFESDLFVASALADMYAKYADLDAAKRVFDEMPERNLVSWNAMIVGFMHNKLYEEAVGMFRRLLVEGEMRPDQVSFSSALSACANLGSLNFGKQVHVLVVKLGLESLAYVNNTLVDMYGKCECLDAAIKLFSSIKDKDVVTWNVMMMSWVQNDCFEEACNCFWVMRREGILPDEASFSTSLHASASLAALNQGTLIHGQIIRTGFQRNLCVRSSLITMYAKCGSLDDATNAFEENKDRNVVSWTAMIAACQQHGCGDRVIQLFEEMVEEKIEPDYITLVCVLSACSHNGLVEKGFHYFDSISQVYRLKPGPEHYACMVDMLGRAGRLEEAKSFIESMPVKPDPTVWGALLGACRNYKNLDVAREVARRLFEMEPENSGNYVLLSNIYMHHGKLEEANQVRRLMGMNGVRKDPGCSWIDIKNTTYVFTVHDKSHPRTDEIYKMLDKLAELAKMKGYVAETTNAVNDFGEYKEQNLWYHSEKLALAFGLISVPVDAPIMIKKNLRTCGDCHTVMKFASEIFTRVIIVRDINRFHRFTNGSCSCGDYW
ncbi:putative pentatricopeptide repeat-containing protein [Cinnamomum micranthum f. kanehirae]|uniref:Putative pentatricopeptide repeat-containing protein n=1 Tax=Cinnamomum micranthum f. kanehirae TaxID=337451 RepID=A0A3S3MSU3_9MAGN|nr:putative pentatricopeptide repeat-containing protein [Cinnamomum micranthum f. kanehirae]